MLERRKSIEKRNCATVRRTKQLTVMIPQQMRVIYESEGNIMFEKSRNLLDCHIAGFTYYDGVEVIDQLMLGTAVTLKAEPENPHDPDAVAIYFEKTKLGYVTQAKNSEISQLLYFGYGDIVEARINSRNLEANPEFQFRISIKLKDKRQ